MSARAFLGGGDLYIARMVNSVFEGYKGAYECRKFEIKPNVEMKEQTSKGRYTFGQVIASVPVPKPADLTIELGEVDREGLAIALLGTSAAVTATAGTVTGESVTVGKIDEWHPLSRGHLGDDYVVTDATGTTTFTPGTDYIINTTFGWIKPLAGGLIDPADELKVNFSNRSYEGFEIQTMTNPFLRARFRLDGVNFVDQSAHEAIVYQAVIAAESAFDFLADDFGSIQMTGRMETPAGFSAPALIRQVRST